MTASIALVTCAQLAEGEDAWELGTALSSAWGHPRDHRVKPSVGVGSRGVGRFGPDGPSLFFRYDQDAAARFAAAVSRRL